MPLRDQNLVPVFFMAALLAFASGCEGAAPNSEHPAAEGRTARAESKLMTNFTCTCSGTVGEYVADYPDLETANRDVATACQYGGSCQETSLQEDPVGGGGSGSGAPDDGFSGGSGWSGSQFDGSNPSPWLGNGGGGGGGGSAAPSPTDTPSGVFVETYDHWNWAHTIHEVHSTGRFDDGDTVRFFDVLKDARNVSAYSSFLNIDWRIGAALAALAKLSDAEINAIVADYDADGAGAGIRVELDEFTDPYSGATSNYVIYLQSNGENIGQVSFIMPSLAHSGSGPDGQGCYVINNAAVAQQVCP